MTPELLSVISATIAAIGTITAIYVARNGAGASAKHFEDRIQIAVKKFGEELDSRSTSAFDNKLELALQRFGQILDERFGKKIEVFVEESTLKLELAVLQTKTEKEHLRLQNLIDQIDHRVARNTQHVSILLDNMLHDGQKVRERAA